MSVTVIGKMAYTSAQQHSVIAKEYKAFLKEIKERILSSQVKAAIAVNRELITLYWEIGSKIHLKRKSEGWERKRLRLWQRT